MWQTVHGILGSSQTIPSLPFIVEKGVEGLTRAWLYFKVLSYTSRNHHDRSEVVVSSLALQWGSQMIYGGSAALNLVLIGKCSNTIFNHYQTIDQLCSRLTKAVKWHYPLYHSIAWKKHSGFVSPHLYFTIQFQTMKLSLYIFKIAVISVKLIEETFKLSMQLVQLSLLLNQNRAVRALACMDMVAKWKEKEVSHGAIQFPSAPIVLDEYVVTGIHVVKQLRGIDKADLEEGISFFETPVTPSPSSNLWEKTCLMGAQVLDTFFVKGKVTPLRINFEQLFRSRTAVQDRDIFPAWGGGANSFIELKKMPMIQDPESTSKIRQSCLTQ